ncbi:unnamed protein product [Candidula unifasciata]|uniref:G-protein coupled receptors family 2 profile 2 domain-containing protein n=1 Tax=Candidula unifasciata TaxID=100452 RepID=A0A8S3ZU36_9EUPU|nr:unnamed protein product [Candidula unifasciata]
MNVVSYDVYKTFTNPVIQNRARETRKYFYRYALYAWGAPLFIVSLCMFIDFTTATSSNDTSVTDEKTIHTCWITQPLAALIAFGAIILLIFFINCIFFGKTIACISKTAKMAKKSLGVRNSNSSVHKRTDTSEVMLYVRMSTVMGFTWIFGLSSSILSSILFTILNTSQGFLIFIAFVCNRRVLGLYMDLFHKAKLLLGHGRRSGIFSVSSTLSSSQNTQQSR